jgi:folylpolyglutamate synthase/dihydropteroate synthase
LTAIYSSLNYLSTHGIKTDISKIRKGIENVVNNTGYHCRFERIKSNGLTYILDVAHNPDAVRNSLDNLKFTRVDTIIFALMNDKNYKLMVNELVGVCDRIIFTRPNSNRSQDPKILFDYAVKISNLNKIETVIKEYFCVYDVKDAIRLSRNLVVKNKRILVIGSFFLVSEAIKALKLQKFLN